MHHQPHQNVEKTFTPLTAVHVANVIDQERSIDPGVTGASFNMEYLTDLGLESRIPEELRDGFVVNVIERAIERFHEQKKPDVLHSSSNDINRPTYFAAHSLTTTG